jgi:hypothetical protein
VAQEGGRRLCPVTAAAAAVGSSKQEPRAGRAHPQQQQQVAAAGRALAQCTHTHSRRPWVAAERTAMCVCGTQQQLCCNTRRRP